MPNLRWGTSRGTDRALLTELVTRRATVTSEAPDEATELATPADKTHPAGSSSTLPANRLEDARIADRVLCGETDALAALVSRYHRPMIRLAQRYVRDQATAEDVVQETWARCCAASLGSRGEAR